MKKVNNTYILPLRAHHLLCSVLYQGKGYSDEFTKNMTMIVDRLRDSDTLLSIQNKLDNICGSCPNLCLDGQCALDFEKKQLENINKNNKDKEYTQIKDLDSFICDSFSISMNEPKKAKDLFKIIESTITKDIFDTCCQNCRWYKQGLCSYEEYKKRLSLFI